MVYFSTSTFFPNVLSFELCGVSLWDVDGSVDRSDDARVTATVFRDFVSFDDDNSSLLVEKS